MKRSLMFGLIFLLGACGGFTSNRHLLQPQQIQASSAANRSIALGLAEYRASLGIRGLCIGSQTPSDEQGAFQRAMVRRLADTAPVVVDARECELTSSGGWRVRESQVAAIRLGVTSITWRSDQIGTGRAGVRIDGQNSFDYDIRVTRVDGPWITDDVFCLTRSNNNICVSINPRVTGQP